ncbi:hypothetical protein AAHA92_04705 [Salvia divinorum]|uniref:Retrotransposon Copia-like N-terminal domain-containing protein n=1 Tax=Salvia divinorum TaxID=28513 RepID=A0ABD1I030_SALDI
MAEEEDNKINDNSNRLRTSKNVTLAVKLNGTNYPLWSRLMKIAVGSRRALRHITGIPPPPAPEDREYLEWEETDLIVFSWIIDNIETDIVVDFAHHQTTQALWESLTVTFESTADPYLIYDLDDKANRMIQGELSLETYWRHLHGMWIDIDRCSRRPIDCCDKGVGQFRNYTATKRLFKFLTGLNEKYDAIRRDILKESPFPSAEAANGWVKREATRLKIMPANPDHPAGATSGESSSGGVGAGFAARSQHPTPNPSSQRSGQPPQRSTAPHRRGGSKPDKSKLWCSHCGMNKHTWETCFKRIGFPELWDENQKAKAKIAIGVEKGSSGGHFEPPGAGSREATNARGRGMEGEATNGGSRRMEVGKIGEAAFARGGGAGGASGFGGYQDEEDNWAWH